MYCRHCQIQSRHDQVCDSIGSCTVVLLLFSVDLDHRPLVKTAANLFRYFCYWNRDRTIASVICAGWDHREGGQVSADNQTAQY